MTHDDIPEQRKEVPATKAKQGLWGGQVLIVLVVALILAMVVWWGVEIYGGAIAPENPVGDPQTTPSPPANGG